MASAPLSSAELDFARALQDTEGLSKAAQDLTTPDPETLDPKTRLLLGIQEEDAKELPSLDDRAAEYDDELRAPEEAEEDQRVAEDDEVFGEEPQEVGAPPPVDEEPPEEAVEVEPKAEQQGELVDENVVEEELPPEPPPAPEPKPEPITRAGVGNLFANRRAHPILLAEVMRSKYQEDWVTWEPETLWWAIRQDFGSIGELTREKVMALRIALRTGFPWTDWDVFENCGTAWNDHMPVFGAMQPMLSMEAAFTVQLLKELRPEFEFENEVNAYLGAICEEAGYVYAPEEWFPGAQRLIDRKDWIAPLRVDVKKAWSKLKSVPAETIQQIEFDPNSPLDIHIGRLVAVREYLAAREGERKSHRATQAAAASYAPVA